jgi:trigger factor
MGDVVIADYTCFVDGKEVEKRPDDWFEIQEKDYLEGFSKQLIGVKPGDERNIETKFPAEFSKKEIAGKAATFNVKVKELKLKSLPELNDELAQSAGEFKTLAELKEHIEKDIRSHKERENEAKYEKDLLDEFVKQNKIDIPEGLVKRRAEKLMENATREFQTRGMGAEKFEEFREKMRADFEKEARRQIHLAFLLDEVANKENIQVTEEEFKERYQTISNEVRQPVEVVEKYYAENEDAREALRDQVRSEKAIQFLKDNVKTNA